MSRNDDPGRVLPGPPTLPAPMDERSLVERLAPESPLLFAWARRSLRDIAGGGAERFLVGRTSQGAWSVLHGGESWLVVHQPSDEVGFEVVAFRTARAAVADAMAGVMVAAGVRVTSGILQLAEIIEGDPIGGSPFWDLGAAGREIRERGGGPSGPRRDGPGVPIGPLHHRLMVIRPNGYFACLPGPPPDSEPYAGLHEIFELAARNLLPPDPGAGSVADVNLPEGTELDGYGGTDQVYLFTPESPFVRRGLWGLPDWHEHRRYRVRRPLRAYTGLPTAHAISTSIGRWAGAPEPSEGQGYYLVNTVADLLRSGELTDVTAPETAGDGA